VLLPVDAYLAAERDKKSSDQDFHRSTLQAIMVNGIALLWATATEQRSGAIAANGRPRRSLPDLKLRGSILLQAA